MHCCRSSPPRPSSGWSTGVSDATISCVHLEIGSLSGVSADSVRFYFPMAAEGTNLAGAKLEISEVPARCRCGSCGAEFEPDGPIPLCACGSPDAAVLSGGSMRILSVEVANGDGQRAQAHPG